MQLDKRRKKHLGVIGVRAVLYSDNAVFKNIKVNAILANIGITEDTMRAKSTYANINTATFNRTANSIFPSNRYKFLFTYYAIFNNSIFTRFRIAFLRTKFLISIIYILY